MAVIGVIVGFERAYVIVRRRDPMRNLKLILAYDGTPYHGWQIQPGLPTIQGELQHTLEKILDHPVVTHGSGRTDAGVHAHGQVVSFTTSVSRDIDALLYGINALLPDEIRVVSIEEVSPEFHARLSAVAKTYEYHLWRLPVVPPFQCRYVYAVGYFLDHDAMDRATVQFCGEHDFTAFCAKATASSDLVREVYEASWERSDQEWVFRIRGNGFLRYMVRTIVGTLLEVGKGRREPDEIGDLFRAKDRSRAGPSAPAQGLHLTEVEY